MPEDGENWCRTPDCEGPSLRLVSSGHGEHDPTWFTVHDDLAADEAPQRRTRGLAAGSGGQRHQVRSHRNQRTGGGREWFLDGGAAWSPSARTFLLTRLGPGRAVVLVTRRGGPKHDRSCPCFHAKRQRRTDHPTEKRRGAAPIGGTNCRPNWLRYLLPTGVRQPHRASEQRQLASLSRARQSCWSPNTMRRHHDAEHTLGRSRR